jgi:hypothetical protein
VPGRADHLLVDRAEDRDMRQPISPDNTPARTPASLRPARVTHAAAAAMVSTDKLRMASTESPIQTCRIR